MLRWDPLQPIVSLRSTNTNDGKKLKEGQEPTNQGFVLIWFYFCKNGNDVLPMRVLLQDTKTVLGEYSSFQLLVRASNLQRTLCCFASHVGVMEQRGFIHRDLILEFDVMSRVTESESQR